MPHLLQRVAIKECKLFLARERVIDGTNQLDTLFVSQTRRLPQRRAAMLGIEKRLERGAGAEPVVPIVSRIVCPAVIAAGNGLAPLASAVCLESTKSLLSAPRKDAAHEVTPYQSGTSEVSRQRPAWKS